MDKSKRYELNKEDAKKIGKSFLLGMAGAGLVWLVEMLPQVDFGPAYTPIVCGLSPVLINFVRKWLSGKK